MVAEAILSLCKAIGEMIASHEKKNPNQTSESNSKTSFVFPEIPQIYYLLKVMGIVWFRTDIRNKPLALVLFVCIE